MNIIKNFKISLMEKQFTPEKDEKKNIGNFVIKCSATLNTEELLKYLIFKTEENYLEQIHQLVSNVYDDLIKENKNNKIDTVGIWITNDKGLILDNSIRISVLDDIKNYGVKNINPIIEFFKMTYENN